MVGCPLPRTNGLSHPDLPTSLRGQEIIAALRRACLMVSSIRRLVDAGC